MGVSGCGERVYGYVAGCGERVYGYVAGGVRAFGEAGKTVTSKIVTVTKSTLNTKFALQCLGGMGALLVPGNAKFTARMLSFATHLEVLMIAKDVQEVLKRPAKNYFSPAPVTERLQAFTDLTFVFAGATFIAKIADDLGVVSLSNAASRMGHFQVLGAHPLSFVGGMHVRTVCLSLLTVAYTCALCKHVYQIVQKRSAEAAKAHGDKQTKPPEDTVKTDGEKEKAPNTEREAGDAAETEKPKESDKAGESQDGKEPEQVGDEKKKESTLTESPPSSPKAQKPKKQQEETYQHLGLEVAYDAASIATYLTMLGFIFPAQYAVAGGGFTVLAATAGFIKSYNRPPSTN